MPVKALVIRLAVGAFSGWLAGQLVVGSGFGVIGNIVLGILGSLVAGWLLPRLGIHIGSGTIGFILNASIGGVVVLLLLSLVRRT